MKIKSNTGLIPRKSAEEVRAILTRRADMLRSLLLPYQAEWMLANHRYMCGVWARQTGKSFCTAFIIAVSMVLNPNTEWMIAAPSERQSLESLRKVKEWLESLQIAFGSFVEALKDVDMKAHGVELRNGSRCTAVPGKPDTVRGFSANVWMDEFAFFEDPAATWRAILPSITNPLRGGEKRVIITSTPNGRVGVGKKFYELAHAKPGAQMTWHAMKITLRDAIARGLPTSYEELAEAIDDPLAVAQELDCQFLDCTNTLLPYDIIALAESFEASEAAEPEFWREGGRDIRLGIDFGRTNDPTVCWTFEKIGDVLYTREVLVLKNMPAPQQEDILRTRIRAARRVCFDYTGPGIGLGDYLAKDFGSFEPAKHSFGKIELCIFTARFKREIFPRLRRAFEAPTRLRIPVSPDIREDLHAMEQIIHGGEYTYAAPHTAEGHSDRCTALALALRAAEGATPPHIGVISRSSIIPGAAHAWSSQAHPQRPALTWQPGNYSNLFIDH